MSLNVSDVTAPVQTNRRLGADAVYDRAFTLASALGPFVEHEVGETPKAFTLRLVARRNGDSVVFEHIVLTPDAQ